MEILTEVDGGDKMARMATDNSDVFGAISELRDAVNTKLALAIIYKKDMGPAVPFPEEQSLMLLAKDQNTFDVWSDGINFVLGKALLDQKAKTKLFESDFETHLNLDLRMSLLNPSDTFPFEEMPIVPPPPPNYNFNKFKICPETRTVISK